jgi:hypothetical protein
MSKSIYRGYAIDAEKEELSFESRNLGGIGDILEKLRIDIIGASKIPHTLLFGESPGGLGSTGRSEERDFAKTLADYQTAVFKRPLKQLMEYILLSKTGPTNGRLPESWRVHFNDLYELNEREKADVRARVAAVDGRYIQLGVLHPKEVADARYGGSEWSMELTLDPSLPRELPMQGQGKAVPPGGRDPLDQTSGSLPMEGTRNAADSAGPYIYNYNTVHERSTFVEEESEANREEEDSFSDKELHQQAVAAAKNRFAVYPSAYAGAYISQKYKDLYKRKHGSMKGAFKGKKTAMVMPKTDAVEAIKVSGLLLNDYDEAALVNQSDIDAALNEWKAEAPERFKDILEATNVEPG